jgi:glucokinase
MVEHDRVVVGVDFGGTNVKAGVCDASGRLLSFVRQPTVASKSPDAVLGQIAEVVARVIDESGRQRPEFAGVAVGACGLVNRQEGTFVESSVLPGWHEVPIAEVMGRALDLPIIVDNDANAAVFGEWWVGVARGTRNVVGMTLGTGIGGCAVLDGTIFYGAGGYAGEFGHMTVDPDGPQCFCGNRGCLGLLASATAMVTAYAYQLGQRTRNDLAGRLENTEAVLSAEGVYEAARGGDMVASGIVKQVGRYLGIGVANLLSCFNPEMVIFTGGMTRMGDYLLDIIRQEARGRTYSPIYEGASIDFGRLGDKAGVVGAAGILFHEGWR